MIFAPENQLEEITELIREAPPSHYSFKIQSFSLLSTNSVEKYKWNLLLYPKGDSSRNVNDHISLYLVIDTTSLPPGFEVNVVYRFFVFDQIRDKYLTLGDYGGSVRRFHGIRTNWGFSKLMPLATFINPSNGYLVDDACEFGVEIFIVQNTGGSECLSMLITPVTHKHTWKVEDFSELTENCYSSDIFFSGDHNWKIALYPNGTLDGQNTCLSLFLFLPDLINPLPSDDAKVYVKFKFSLKNQICGRHIERKEHYWFKSTTDGWGWPEFITLKRSQRLNQGLSGQ